MKKIFTNFNLSFLVLGALFCVPAAGQTLVNGTVQEDTGKPFPFANVLLLSATDSALVKGMLSGETGLYSFENVKPGSYLVSTSAVGYKQTYSKTFTIDAAKPRLQLNPLILSGSSKELKEVAVVAAKPLFEQHLDRMVVNVQSSITSAGATALEVLERSPGISLNRQNNSLSMSGKDGVVVMINGKQSRVPMATIIQMLSGMSAGNIEKIELITTPSAQFDAEGNAGIINIIMKKNENYGTNGSYALTMGYGWYQKPAANFNLNHRVEKLNLYGDYSFMLNQAFQRMENNNQFYKQNQLTQINTINRRQPTQRNHNIRAGFDYLLSPKTTLSGLIAGFSNKWHTGRVDERSLTEVIEANVLTSTIDARHQEVNHWRHLMGNLNLNHKLTPKQELSFDVDYLYYHDRNPHHYTNNYAFIADNSIIENQVSLAKLTPIQLWVSRADYKLNLAEQTKLEMGVKGTLTKLQNDVEMKTLADGVWQINPEFSRDVNMLENIGAAYVNFNHQLSKIKVQTGLRYEYTHTDLTTPQKEQLVERRYGNLFPSIFLSRDLTKKSSLQLSYSRRITRPTYNDLAPFVYFINPYTFLSGNTNLRATITDAVQVNYRFRESYLTSFSYSYDKNPIISWQMHVDPETNKSYARAENLLNSGTYSLNFSVPLKLTSWWQLQSNLMGVWQRNRTLYEGKAFELAAGYVQLNLSQTFTLPNNFSAELSGFYVSKSPFGIAYINPLGALNVGIQKKLNQEKGTFRLSVDDLFWTNRFIMINHQAALNMHTTFRGAFSEPRIIRLTFSRNFGNTKVKAATKRETSSEEERKRAGN